MRKIGEIMEQLMQMEMNDEIRMLIKELNNTCGTVTQEVKEDIMSAVMAESEPISGKEGEFVSVSALKDIVWNAGKKV